MRRLLMAILVPPLLIAVAALVLIGLKDFYWLVATVSTRIVGAIVTGLL